MLEKTVQEVNFSSTSTTWKKNSRRQFEEYSLQDKFSRHFNGYDKARLLEIFKHLPTSLKQVVVL